MAIADLVNEGWEMDTSWDDIVIVKHIEGIPGGRTLNVEDVTEEVIKAGHIIIEDDNTKELKPLKIDGENYESLPAEHSYQGILYKTILTKRPLAPVMVRGTVNEKAAQNYGLPEYPGDAKTALSLIRFTED